MEGAHHEADINRLHLIRGGMQICVVLGLLGVLVSGFMVWQQYRQPILNAVPERINPNTAAAASLVRLPNIGMARASDIIAYRENVEPGQTPFETVHDLENIHGIGPKTAEVLEPWLTFKEEPQ